MERKRSQMTDGTERLFLLPLWGGRDGFPIRINRLCGIFDHEDVVLLGYRHDSAHIARHTGIMNRHNDFGTRGNEGF